MKTALCMVLGALSVALSLGDATLEPTPAGAASLSQRPTATPATPTRLGVGPFDLGDTGSGCGYKLTLPVDENDNLSGSAFEVFPSLPSGCTSWQPGDLDLLSYSHPQYFLRTPQYYEFRSPLAGATTATASNARCELRHLRDYGVTERMSHEFVFQAFGAADGVKIIIGQIHRLGDRADPVFKLVYTSRSAGTGRYRALVKPVDGASDVELVLQTNIVDGDFIAVRYEWDPVTEELTFLTENYGFVNPGLPTLSNADRDTMQGVKADDRNSYKKLGAYVNDEGDGAQTDIQRVLVYHDREIF